MTAFIGSGRPWRTSLHLCCLLANKSHEISFNITTSWCMYDVGVCWPCGPTCEVLLPELDQWENHAVGHLVGQLGVERVQLENEEQIIQKKISSGARQHTHQNVPRPNILRDFSSFRRAEWCWLPATSAAICRGTILVKWVQAADDASASS